MEQDERKEPSADDTQPIPAATDATGSEPQATDQGDGQSSEPKAEEEQTGAPV